MSETWDSLLPPLLAEAGVEAGTSFTYAALTGGVSSDIIRIDIADGRQFCAKRALSQLKVKSLWEAPIERNRYEVAYLRTAGFIVPGAVPQVLGEDQKHGIALLEYLPASNYALWKAELLAGRADPKVPVAVAEALGRIHAATFNDASVARAFATDQLIDALRFDPYLRHTAKAYPDLSERILAVLEETARSKQALVHGDVSPKNILIARADGHPVLLDAECAWYGDPAFDAAFCANHLLLKSVHLPALAAELRAEAAAFVATWLAAFPADRRAELERRVAALLPCLFLARVDGKSPVEYLDEPARQRVRDLARPLISAPPATMAAFLSAF